MKKTLILAVVCAMALGLGAVSAQAITLTTTTNQSDAVFLGYIIDGIPPELDNQKVWLNSLLGLAPGATTTVGSETIVRSGFSCGDCPAPAVAGVKTDGLSATVNTLNLTGYDFVIGKYGGGANPNDPGRSLVWWVNLTGDHQLQGTYDGKALSNASRWTGTSVPDGGMTLMLLGGALLGLESLRRRFRA